MKLRRLPAGQNAQLGVALIGPQDIAGPLNQPTPGEPGGLSPRTIAMSNSHDDENVSGFTAPGSLVHCFVTQVRKTWHAG